MEDMNKYGSSKTMDKTNLKNIIEKSIGTKLSKYISNAIILFTFILIGIIITLFIFKVKVDKESKEESPGCPSYSCPEKSDECGFSPFFYDHQQNNKKLCQSNYYFKN